MNINIHSHQEDSSAEVILHSFFHYEKLTSQCHSHLKSCGIHPWHIEEVNTDEAIQYIALLCEQKKIVAIGECGLDKNRDGLGKQIQVFKKQILLSEKYQLPLIIHSVKTHQYLVEIRQEMHASQPWVIHGFSSSLPMANQLIKYDMYLSFGHQLLNHSKCQQVFVQLPLNRIFFETDDKKELTVEIIYQKAKSLLNLPLSDIEKQIETNYKKIFNAE